MDKSSINHAKIILNWSIPPLMLALGVIQTFRLCLASENLKKNGRKNRKENYKKRKIKNILQFI